MAHLLQKNPINMSVDSFNLIGETLEGQLVKFARSGKGVLTPYPEKNVNPAGNNFPMVLSFILGSVDSTLTFNSHFNAVESGNLLYGIEPLSDRDTEPGNADLKVVSDKKLYDIVGIILTVVKDLADFIPEFISGKAENGVGRSTVLNASFSNSKPGTQDSFYNQLYLRDPGYVAFLVDGRFGGTPTVEESRGGGYGFSAYKDDLLQKILKKGLSKTDPVSFNENPDDFKSSFSVTKSGEDVKDKVFSEPLLREVKHPDITREDSSKPRLDYLRNEPVDRLTSFDFSVFKLTSSDNGKQKPLLPGGLDHFHSGSSGKVDLGDVKNFFSVAKSGKEFIVTLEPEGLGKLNIQLSMDHGFINIKINVSNGVVKAFIENNIHSMVDLLLNDGINIGGLSVNIENGKRNWDEGYEYKAFRGNITIPGVERVYTSGPQGFYRGSSGLVSIFV